jgi:hypothetical protein
MLNFLFGNKKREAKRINPLNSKQEMIVRHGTEQIKTLLKKGLSIPVVML